MTLAYIENKNIKTNMERNCVSQKGQKCRTVDVWFRDAATARLHSITSLKTEIVLLSLYFGRHDSRIKVEDISPK